MMGDMLIACLAAALFALGALLLIVLVLCLDLVNRMRWRRRLMRQDQLTPEVIERFEKLVRGYRGAQQ